MANEVIFHFIDKTGADKTENRMEVTNNKPPIRVKSPVHPGQPDGYEVGGFNQSRMDVARVSPELKARIQASILRRGAAYWRRRRWTQGFFTAPADTPWGENTGRGMPRIFWYKKQPDGSFIAGWEHTLEELRETYHWERRHLRQAMLAASIDATVGGRTLAVRRPTRISVHDHHLPGLQHLGELLALSDMDYEVQAPLMRADGNLTFKPTKAELRLIIDAERANHKLAHEKSASTEAEIERLYDGAVADVAEQADTSLGDSHTGYERLFRAFDTERFWGLAPPARPRFAVIQTPPPAPPPPPPTPPEAPGAPDGQPPAPDLKE